MVTTLPPAIWNEPAYRERSLRLEEKDFTKALIKTLIDAQQDSTHLESDDWKRTVYIDTLGVGTTDFEISDQKKDQLIKSGYDCAKKYFAWKNGLKLVAA